MKHVVKTLAILMVLCLNDFSGMAQSYRTKDLPQGEELMPSVRSFLKEIPVERLPDYGIRNVEEIDRATTGEPVKVFLIKDLNPAFSENWRLPLVIDGEYRALFTVVYDENGSLKIVDFGARKLAEEISKQRAIRPIQGLLRVYELKRDFFMEGNPEDLRYRPVPDEGTTAYSLEQILKMIAETK